ncbi:MAG: TolC family protein [Pseudomonadota bacterium]
MRIQRCLPLVGLLLASLVTAGELTDGFQNALQNDPAFQGARAELEANQISAKQAGRAYWPEVGLKFGDRTEAGGSQRTVQVAQPLVSAERLATWFGASSLDLKAEATMQQRMDDLALRYFAIVTELVRTRESLSLNLRKKEALELQAAAAKRAFELGTGTLTDQRDTLVRLQQVRAEEQGLKARRAAAERQFLAITGQPAQPDAFVLARKKRSLVLPDIGQLKDSLIRHNPALITARQNERLADLDVWRKRGAFMPQVNLIAKRTTISSGSSANYVGVAVDFPLQSSSVLAIDASKATARKSVADARAVEQNAILEVERLYALLESGQVESDIRFDAIEAAQLSVEGNKQSYKGGVRSQLDVLNSIQILFEVQDQYVASVLGMASNLVNLHSQVGATPANEILKLLETLLF